MDSQEIIREKPPRICRKIYKQLYDDSSDQKYSTRYYHLKKEDFTCEICKSTVTTFSLKQHQRGKKCQLLRNYGLKL